MFGKRLCADFITGSILSALEITGSYMGPHWPVDIVYDSPKNPMLADMTNATVIPMIPTRHKNGKSYHIAFFKPLSFEFDDEQGRTQAINDLFEEQVTHYPDQYLWLHKRFKPPLGEVNPYDQ